MKLSLVSVKYNKDVQIDDFVWKLWYILTEAQIVIVISKWRSVVVQSHAGLCQSDFPHIWKRWIMCPRELVRSSCFGMRRHFGDQNIVYLDVSEIDDVLERQIVK